MPDRKAPIFLFTGEEFLRRSKIESLIDQLIPASDRPTNLSRIPADDLDWKDVLSQAQTPSLLGGAQVFWISSCDKLKKSEFEIFEDYLSHPVSTSYFIFEDDELSDSNFLLKLVARFGKHIRLGRDGREESMNTFRAKLKRNGKIMTPDAWQMLEERLGASPALMNMVLDQLMLYSDKPEIDETHVQAISSEFLRYEPFDLTEALVQKDIARALKIFHFFYEMTGDITSIVGLLHWQLKRIWQAKRLLVSETKPEEIGRVLRIPPFRLHSFLAQARHFEMGMVEKLLETLWQIDWDSKRGIGEETAAIETFLAGVSS